MNIPDGLKAKYNQIRYLIIFRKHPDINDVIWEASTEDELQILIDRLNDLRINGVKFSYNIYEISRELKLK